MILRWYARPEDAAVAAAIAAHAANLGCPPAAVAISWVLTTPGVTATVVGASSVEQLDQVVGYAERPFERADMAAVQTGSSAEGRALDQDVVTALVAWLRAH